MADDNDKMGLRGKVTDIFDRELGIENEPKKPEPTPEPEPEPQPDPEPAIEKDLEASARTDDPRGLGFDDVGEGTPTGETHQQSDDEMQAQNRRNMAIAFSVLGFVILVYLATFFRLADNLKAAAGAS